MEKLTNTKLNDAFTHYVNNQNKETFMRAVAMIPFHSIVVLGEKGISLEASMKEHSYPFYMFGAEGEKGSACIFIDSETAADLWYNTAGTAEVEQYIIPFPVYFALIARSNLKEKEIITVITRNCRVGVPFSVFCTGTRYYWLQSINPNATPEEREVMNMITLDGKIISKLKKDLRYDDLRTIDDTDALAKQFSEGGSDSNLKIMGFVARKKKTLFSKKIFAICYCTNCIQGKDAFVNSQIADDIVFYDEMAYAYMKGKYAAIKLWSGDEKMIDITFGNEKIVGFINALLKLNGVTIPDFVKWR